MLTRSRILLLPLVFLALLVTACGGGPSEPRPVSGEMEELLHEVAAMRQLEAPSGLRIETVTPRDFPDLPGELTGPQEIGWERETRLYRLLGFLSEDQHLPDVRRSLSSSVFGFYSWEGILGVVTEDGGVDLEDFSPDEREAIVHAMIYALQDYHFDLRSTYRNLGWNLDLHLGFRAVIEGDATVHISRFTGTTTTEEAYEFLAAPYHITNVPASIAREFAFQNSAGSAWAREVLATQGVEALNTYLRYPPSTTVILHPELMESDWEPERLTSPFPGLRSSLIPLGLEATAWGSLGEFLLLNYLLSAAPTPSDWRQGAWTGTALEAAAGWAGDSYYLYGGVEEGVVAVRVRFVSEEDAHEFAEAQREVATAGAEVVEDGAITIATKENGNVTAMLEPVGRDVIFAIGTSAEVARAAVEPLVGG
ncbi:MAG: hypothetical protein OXE43_11540 [Chloroflexi bacterium]|nr:hypothetical protein [Chloroflexota bacterium]